MDCFVKKLLAAVTLCACIRSAHSGDELHHHAPEVAHETLPLHRCIAILGTANSTTESSSVTIFGDLSSD